MADPNVLVVAGTVLRVEAADPNPPVAVLPNPDDVDVLPVPAEPNTLGPGVVVNALLVTAGEPNKPAVEAVVVLEEAPAVAGGAAPNKLVDPGPELVDGSPKALPGAVEPDPNKPLDPDTDPGGTKVPNHPAREDGALDATVGVLSTNSKSSSMNDALCDLD